jgi:hypothetical protein
MRLPNLWRFTAMAGACCVLNLLAVDQVSAQARSAGRVQFQRSRGPTVSPYTSLLNGGNGNTPNLNYFNIVKPRQQQQKMQRSLANEIQSVDNRFQALQAPQNMQSGQVQQTEDAISSGRLMPTGHKTSFGNTGSYFPGAGAPR